MIKNLIQTTIFVKLLKIFWRLHYYFRQRVYEIYKNSQTFIPIQRLWDKIRICFRYSFLEKITNTREEGNNMVFNESKVVRWWINLYRKRKQEVSFFLKISRTNSSVKELKKELNYLTVKNTSIIMVVAILTNIMLSILLKKQILLLGWIIRYLLLSMGISGLFCNATWKDIMRTSYFIRQINIYKF